MSRVRHPWAWGFVDRFPDDGARRGLAQLASALLGGAFEPVPLRPLDAAPDLPAARIAPPSALAHLCDVSPAGRAARTYGRAYPDLVRGMDGDFAAAPDFVARPRSEDDVVALLAWCDAERLAAVPFGGGTSVVGGVECPRDVARGVVTLDLGALDRVHEVDPVSRAARIGAGASGPVLDAQLAAHGLTLRHYPQSYELSTLGGWLATRAGGHYATVYTHIDELCEAMRVVTPRGIVATPRLPASGAGPSPDRLFLGSEGTLGVITEAWMRVQQRPRWRASATLKFARFADGVTAARHLAQSGLFPTNCRLLDGHEARLHRVGFDGASVLILGFESSDHPLTAWLARAVELARDAGGALASGPSETDDGAGDAAGERSSRRGEAGSWRQAFLDAPYLQSALISVGVLVDTFETACTWDRFDALDAAVRAAVHGALDAECGGGVVSCRFTHVYPDGPAPYYTFLGRARRGAELAQWRTIKRAASDALAAHGGTITHHHAVGRTHRPWYDRERPPLFAEVLAAAKRTLDPGEVLNPGVVIGERGASAGW
jgi:alkyldihydroxyacetonephosphate synthase